MSTRDRLESLTANLTVPQARSEGVAQAKESEQAAPSQADRNAVETKFPPITPGRPAATSPKTGPGQLLAFRGQTLALETEIARLKDALAMHDGAQAVRKLDPTQVKLSKWANRHESTYKSPQFLRLKDDIEHAGGNVQPILVRALDGAPDQYEIIFGHRRHRACLELGIAVLAAIWTEPLADEVLVAFMDRENRERADLSPYEQGMMYQRALDEHLYRSNRQLAEALGVSHTWVNKALVVAQLPPAIVDCFATPLDIQHRHAELIAAALDKDRRGVLKRAERLRDQRLSASSIVALLLETPKQSVAVPSVVRLDKKIVGSVRADAKGAINIRLKPGVVGLESLEELAEVVNSFLLKKHPPAESK
jgi:ParB family chromosome partitioning protein